MRLIADIGGTNARFALFTSEGGIDDVRVLPTADYDGPASAARAYLDGRAIEEAILAVATPVEADEVRLTNCPWHFSIKATGEEIGAARIAAINDFVAQALALPHLQPGDVVKIGPGEPARERTMVAMGPGTGLGVAVLLPLAGGCVPLPTEGGHASFAPNDAREIEVLRLLSGRFGHVSTERLVSGPGLLTLAEALAALDGRAIEARTPAEVTDRARRGCSHCAEAVTRFAALLGSAAGDSALAHGATGGVYLCGGVMLALGDLFDRNAFRARFEAKGRFDAYLRAIPTWIVTHPHAGLLGAAHHYLL